MKVVADTPAARLAAVGIRRSRKREETGIQIAVAGYIRFNHPDVLFTISPSGMKLSINVAKRLKAMGYRAGTPDLLILEPRGGFNGLLMELKTSTGTESPKQHEFLRLAFLRGYKTAVCHSQEDAILQIKTYLNS